MVEVSTPGKVCYSDPQTDGRPKFGSFPVRYSVVYWRGSNHGLRGEMVSSSRATFRGNQGIWLANSRSLLEEALIN